MVDERSVQTVSTPFSILENKGHKGNVVWMLNENLNQYQYLILHAFNKLYTFNNVERPVQTTPTFVEANVETGRSAIPIVEAVKCEI